MAEGKLLEISKAKGRPMLTWVGKRPLAHIIAYPAQHVETYDPTEDAAQRAGEAWNDWPQGYPRGGLLFHGDNKEVLAHLLANGFRGKVKLVYIDPPFDSGADYVRKVSLRGATGTAKLDGEGYALGEQVQYTDIWANDSYLQFVYERLLLLRELLSDDGSIYLHCDWHKSHHLRCLMDEVFGADNLRNEIVWQRTAARSDSTTYNHIHDTLFFYAKGGEFVWNPQYEPYSDDYLSSKYVATDEKGGKYQLDNLTSPNPRPNMTYEWMGYAPPAKGWRYSKASMQRLHDEGRIWYPTDKSKRPRLKRYLDEVPGRPLQSIWTDVFPVNSQAAEREDYPTQKPEALLERIIKVSSNPDDLVLDCFIGSGTTAAVGQKLGRRWIGCDINKGAIQTTMKRLMAVMGAQSKVRADEAARPPLPYSDGDDDAGQVDNPPPAQVSVAVYRVNDYDLQIQHNEAVNLACDYMGIVRTRSDAFFDGTRSRTSCCRPTRGWPKRGGRLTRR
jgi:DNA modification methylase